MVERDKSKKTSSDMFGRSRSFGYPIDISGLENAGTHKSLVRGRRGSKSTFLDALIAAIFEMCEEKGNPRTILIKKEEEGHAEEIRLLTTTWLHEALKRLPKNQELCIYLRFRFDDVREYKQLKNCKEPVLKELRTTQEIADIIGISQATVYRNIESGVRNLKKDFELHLKPLLANKEKT